MKNLDPITYIVRVRQRAFNGAIVWHEEGECRSRKLACEIAEQRLRDIGDRGIRAKVRQHGGKRTGAVVFDLAKEELAP